MILYRVYSTVEIAHDITADGVDEAREKSWLWAQTLPDNYEVLDHCINYRLEVRE